MDCRSESGYFHVLGEDAKLQSKLLETRRGREVISRRSLQIAWLFRRPRLLLPRQGRQEHSANRHHGIGDHGGQPLRRDVLFCKWRREHA